MPIEPSDTVAFRLLAGLAARGIRTFLANAGTDFAPLIEAYVRGGQRGVAMPRFVNVPHEQVAVSMAHGAHLIDGGAQVVGVHHTVGTANTVSAVMTAARERIPLLLLAGRAPSTEHGSIASRDVVVHWGTDTFDQGGLIREYTKWDHELREGQSVEAILDRALDIAMTVPRGPVYLTLPREVLVGLAVAAPNAGRPRVGASGPRPDAAAIAQLADWLLAAQRPMVVASSAGRDQSVPAALAAIAAMAAVPVVEHYPRAVNLPRAHPMHAGFDPAPLVAQADLVLVLDCEVPWLPRAVSLPAGGRVVHIGTDPLYARIPVRSFPVDLAIVSETGPALRALETVLRQRWADDTPAMTRRRAQAAERQQRQKVALETARQSSAESATIDPSMLALCLRDLLDDDCVVLNEYGLPLELMDFAGSPDFFSAGISGALGWTMAAALGVQMAAPHKTVIAVVGDGSYMFGNPTPCHYIAAAERLPILTIVLNNAGYAAVRRAVEVVYPDGAAVRETVLPLTAFDPQPRYEGIAAACGAHAERVDSPTALRERLHVALDMVRTQRRQVLLNVICQPRTREESP